MSVQTPVKVADLYGGGENGQLILGHFDTPKVQEWLQRRHAKARQMIGSDGMYSRDGHEWKVPYGVRVALKERLTHNQMAVQYPFYVTWVSPKTNKRHKKYVGSIIAGVNLIATRLQYVDPQASIVSRTVGYHCPPKLRGKFPRVMNGKKVYWCPLCMTARSFKRHHPVQEFNAPKKFWSEEKQRYVWKDVRLAVLECTVCGCTNRDTKFRSSNQPYELRRIKKGVRRVKGRR